MRQADRFPYFLKPNPQEPPSKKKKKEKSSNEKTLNKYVAQCHKQVIIKDAGNLSRKQHKIYEYSEFFLSLHPFLRAFRLKK